MPKILILFTALVAAVTLTACGDDDTPTADGRRVEITMEDNAFSPAEIDVEAGETVTFVFTNEGAALHEAFIGTAEEQDEHAMTMGEDEGHHGGSETEAVEVEPGASAEVRHTFDDAGTVVIGCHQPGHYEDGMAMTVEVA